MKTPKSKKGGIRKNAGRPPSQDPKIQFPLYVRKSRIDLLNREYCRNVAEEAIEETYIAKGGDN